MTAVSAISMDATIDEFIEKTQLLDGTEVHERSPWNNVAAADAIRHFAFGTSDDNPLWTVEAYARQTSYGTLVAPPAFLTSVLYPILHGAPMSVPLSSLIGGLEYQWFLPILAGDDLRAVSRQARTFEKKSRSGRRLVFIISEVVYRNQRDEIVAKATGTMIRATQVGTELLFDRPLYRYSQDELDAIGKAIEAEVRTGREMLCWDDVAVGTIIPSTVRGPLTIGDLVAWQAAIGPSYRAGSLGYLDCLKSPHSAVKNPITGWPVKYSQQHEDFHLAAQRGMPGPFDNGVMRFAWVAPLITNWMGDQGVLRRLYVQIKAPVLYADTTWYSGTVVEKHEEEQGGVIKIQISGVNQLGITTTAGEADVVLPRRFHH